MKQKKSPKKKSAASKSPVIKKRLITRLITFAVLVVILGGAFAAYRLYQNNLHDVSVVGNGQSTVVQVYEPGCIPCDRLRENVDAVKGRFDNVQFKYANLFDDQGAEFARGHNARETTLLIFDSKGKLRRTLTGVQPTEQLERIFSRL